MQDVSSSFSCYFCLSKTVSCCCWWPKDFNNLRAVTGTLSSSPAVLTITHNNLFCSFTHSCTIRLTNYFTQNVFPGFLPLYVPNCFLSFSHRVVSLVNPSLYPLPYPPIKIGASFLYSSCKQLLYTLIMAMVLWVIASLLITLLPQEVVSPGA